MKKNTIKSINIFYLLIAFLLTSCDNKNQNSGTIEADLSALPEKFDKIAILMEKREHQGDSIEIKDTITVINGKFNYQFKLKQPKSMYFTLLKNNKEVGELTFEDEKFNKGMFLGNPTIGNENIIITYKEDKHLVNKDLSKDVHVVQIEGAEENRMYHKTFYKNLLNENFIKENPNSYPLLWQMLQYSDKYSSSQLEGLSSGFSPELKKSTTFTILKKIISEKKDIEKYGFVKSFNWLDINGKGYQYNQVLEGKKRMLIIFWASWCVPCRKEIPALKEFYKEYNEDISMVSLSIDNDYSNWKKAVDQEQMPWLNLSGLPKNKNAISQAYNIKAVPTLILLDEKGKIIEKNTNDLPKIIDIINNKK